MDAFSYLMAALILPEQVDDAAVDLAAPYDQHHRWFFGFFLATLCISIVKDVVLAGHRKHYRHHGTFGR